MRLLLMVEQRLQTNYEEEQTPLQVVQAVIQEQLLMLLVLALAPVQVQVRVRVQVQGQVQVQCLLVQHVLVQLQLLPVAVYAAQAIEDAF